MSRLLLLLSFAFAAVAAAPRIQPKPTVSPADWATYNYDTLGTRYNKAEKKLSPTTVGDLEEKWRFPAKGSLLPIVGVIHATPVVVNGYVYFATAIMPAVYKLTPDGKVKWTYTPKNVRKAQFKTNSGVPDSGFLNSPLVTDDTVYVADIGGYVYALNRSDGKERWKVDTRSAPFPGAHASNCVCAAPVLVHGKLIVGGGAFEHGYAAMPGNKGCTGRGFVVALDPKDGKTLWKYDVGPEPGPLDPPVKIKDAYGEHVFHFGPSTSSVWSTPSYDPQTKAIFFGTDAHNSPKQPTKEDPGLSTKHSCAVIALDAETGKERWVTQINKGDVWHYAMRAYDPETGLYKDQSIGDTPKPYNVTVGGKTVRAVGVGCKNGGFYVLDARTGQILHNTPVYRGAPAEPPNPAPHPRTLALPGVAGGLQTGIATDGQAIYTNGIDHSRMATSEDSKARGALPTGGRVVSISLDTTKENWRHERRKVAAVGGTKEKPAFTNVGDPVGSGIALANGVAFFTTTVSNKLVALDTASGRVLKEIHLGAVWCGPSVSRGRVYVGSGNLLFAPGDPREEYFPKAYTGTLYSFGLPGKDEVSELGKGDE